MKGELLPHSHCWEYSAVTEHRQETHGSYFPINDDLSLRTITVLLISTKLGLGKETGKLSSAATEIFLPSNAHKYFKKKQQTSNTYVIKLEQLRYWITRI